MGAPARLEDLVFNQKWFLPLVLLGPMVVGMILQYRFIEHAKDWNI